MDDIDEMDGSDGTDESDETASLPFWGRLCYPCVTFLSLRQADITSDSID
jgi:hypothetical protein